MTHKELFEALLAGKQINHPEIVNRIYLKGDQLYFTNRDTGEEIKFEFVLFEVKDCLIYKEPVKTYSFKDAHYAMISSNYKRMYRLGANVSYTYMGDGVFQLKKDHQILNHFSKEDLVATDWVLE